MLWERCCLSTTMPWIYQLSYRNSRHIWNVKHDWEHQFDDIDLPIQASIVFSIFKISYHFKHQCEMKRMNRKSDDWTDFHWIDQSRCSCGLKKKKERTGRSGAIDRAGSRAKRSTVDCHFFFNIKFTFQSELGIIFLLYPFWPDFNTIFSTIW